LQTKSIFQNRWAKWTAIFLTWTAVALFFASQSTLWDRYLFRQQITWQRAITINFSFYYVWAILAPGVLWLRRRYRFEGKKWPKSLLVHIPASLAIAGMQLFLAESIWNMVRDEPLSMYEAFRSLEFSFAFNFQTNALTYWVILGFGYTLEYYRQFRDRELRASQLQAELMKANLQALKMQLQPHFLFNTLNSISSLMHKNVKDADKVVARLGDLLRYSLETEGIQEVSLRDELDFLRRYLEIEKIRFGNRLHVSIRISNGVLQAKVPNLILQPLVENAIRYGVGPRSTGGKIEIIAGREDDMLDLVVRDDGPGLPHGASADFSEGVGLHNTRSRLEQLYGENHSFRLKNSNGKGLEVQLRIPYHEESMVEE
jgi:signal transduction histidine kinase